MKILAFLLFLGGATALGVGGNAGVGKDGKVNGNVNADLGFGGCGRKGPSISAQGQGQGTGPGSASSGNAGASGSIDLGGKNSDCATTTSETQTSTTEMSTTTKMPTTTETPTTTAKPCKQYPVATSYLAGLRTDETFPNGKITFFYECYGTKTHYTGGGTGSKNVTIPRKANCSPARYVGAKANMIVQDGNIVSYRLSCSVLYANRTLGKRIAKSSLDFDNKMVQCDEFQVMTSLQAIKHDDGKYEIKIDCQGFRRT